jgi:hypothetical protein
LKVALFFGISIALHILKPQSMNDKTKITGHDSRRISFFANNEAEDWKSKFGVSTEDLKDALRAVGSGTRDMEAYFRNRK